MSGAPIVQNNKFVGAVTHVLVQKPDTGYAVFADLMIKQSREIKWKGEKGASPFFPQFDNCMSQKVNKCHNI